MAKKKQPRKPGRNLFKEAAAKAKEKAPTVRRRRTKLDEIIDELEHMDPYDAGLVDEPFGDR